MLLSAEKGQENMENLTGGVKSIEDEAEKTLEQARTKASEILVRAKEESQQIASVELPLDEVKAEGESIKNKAKAEAEKQVAQAHEKASNMIESVGVRTDEIVRKIVNIVTGAD